AGPPQPPPAGPPLWARRWRRSPPERSRLPPPQTPASPRSPRQDPPLAPLARHAARSRRDEHRRPAARGTLPERLPQGRRLTVPQTSASYGEVGQGDSICSPTAIATSWPRRCSARRSSGPQHEPPPQLDLGGEPVRERVLLRVDHDATAGVEPAHALTREHG